MGFLARLSPVSFALLKTRAIEILIPICTLVGLGLCLFLVWIGLSEGPVVGCGAGGGCQSVLGSRWSQVFLIPVSWYGTAFYAVWVACEVARLRVHRAWFAGAAAGAALWFIVVQAFLLKAFCPWCMSLHAIGMLLGVLILVAGGKAAVRQWAQALLASGLGLGLVQVYGPEKPAHLVENRKGGEVVAKDDSHVSFDGGKIRFALDEYPRLGSPKAKHVVVEMFDYQCISCRLMSGYLKALVEAYPEQVSVLLVPVPMDRGCNPHLRGGGDHDGSCEISRIAMAVWDASPEGFVTFHEALMGNPSETLARELALAFLDESSIAEAMEDKKHSQVLEHNIRAWKQLSGTSSSLPKLLISDRRILHGMPASRSAFLQLMKEELSLD